MASLTGEQLKDSYQSLVTIGDSITSNPTSGLLENGLGNTLGSITIKGVDPIYKVDGDATSSTARVDFFDESVQKAFLGITTTSNWAGLSNDVEGDLFLATHGTNNSSANVALAPAQSVALRAKSGGDIAFLDTSSNEAFYWDASTARLGLGTTSPDTLFHLEGTDNAIIRLTNKDTSLTSNQIIGGVEFEKLDGSGAGAGVVGGMRMYSGGSVGESAYLTFSTSSSSTNNVERMRIDSSGNVGIGDSTIANPFSSAYSNILQVGTTSGNTRLAITAGTSSACDLQFADSVTSAESGTYAGYISYKHASDNMVFGTATSEAMRIDSSGNVLVGNTSYNNVNVGVGLGASGYLYATRDNTLVSSFNRLTSDGTITDFRKDGTIVGIIGTGGGSLDVYSSGASSVGLRFAQAVIPMLNGSVDDGNVDLGTSTRKYKDLYLGGSVYLGGTASANALDDYEEGTWTPVLRGSATAGTYETTTAEGYYTKVGNMVSLTARIFLAGSITGGGSGYAQITGAPFTKGANMAPQGSVKFSGVDLNNAGKYTNVEFISSSATSTLYFVSIADNATAIDENISAFSASDFFMFSITYFV